MEKKCAEERWALINSTENSVKTPQDGGGGGEEEDDDDEVLSLRDHALIPLSRKENEEESTPFRAFETQDDFDFCSLSKESEMCAADDVFYQGQILPLRHSMSSEKGLLQRCHSLNFSRLNSRSESMDHYSSGGLISSRSSSISSHQSSSSGSSIVTADPNCKPKLPPRNRFHSHSSPSPRIRFPGNRQKNVGISNKNCAKKPSVWKIFRQGLLTTPPEIAFHDLKPRCPSNTNSKNFGSRNSTSSNSSSFSSSSDKKKIKLGALLGGCNCLVDAVDTVPSKVVIIKRSASDSESEVRALRVEEDNLLPVKSPKKRLSHRRTFEWLKQLSLEGAACEH